MAVQTWRLLTLPGWQGSGAQHWQTLWEAQLGCQRVEQHDWVRPRRGDWMARLDEVLLDDERPALLIAHSLGCELVAAWAAHSRHVNRVHGALLVAPPDLSQSALRQALPGWWPPAARQRLPFPSTLVASRSDPYADPAHSAALADAWGSELVWDPAGGHLNAESGLGDWPRGRALLQALGAVAQPMTQGGQ